MTDLVRTFEAYCEDNLYLFSYGSESHLNLIEADQLDPEQIYLLLFPVVRHGVQNKTKTRISGTKFTGKFMLLKGSDYAKHYFNENDSSQADSKYTRNIEPLLTLHNNFGSVLLCQGLDLNEWKCQDAVDIMDANKDGVWCTFNIYQEF